MNALRRRPLNLTQLSAELKSSTSGFPWLDGDMLYAADLNNAFVARDAAISGMLPLSGGTMQGPLAIGDGTGGPLLTLNGAAGTAKGIDWQTAGTNRWRLETSAADDLWLSAYSATGVYNGTPLQIANSGSALTINTQLALNATGASPVGNTLGIWSTTTNNGLNALQGAKFGYFSSFGGGTGGFDTGLTNIAIFDPVFVAGAPPFYQAQWTVAVSPNDTSHNWNCIASEINIVNRGADMGWKRDRTTANPTGGYLMVPETATFGGSGGGEGKHVTFAYSLGHSGGNNSTGFPAKFYNGLLIEPNAIVGQTGRAIYATGDITGTSSQYPYGPMQTDGTWLHGIDHTKATYGDGAAETLPVGQTVRWIVGPTTAPTASATIGASGSGSNASLTLTPAGTGSVTIAGGAAVTTSLQVGAPAASGMLVTINSAVQTSPGVMLQSAGVNRWKIALDAYPESGGGAGSSLDLYSYTDAGGFWNTALSIGRASGSMYIQGGFGLWGGGPPASKPSVTGSRGGNAALASLLTALAAYGLVTDSTTA